MTAKEQDISTELEKYKKEGCNLLMPSTHIAGLSEYHQPIIETVQLSIKPDDGDVYPHDGSDDGAGKKWRPTKQALMKLSVCAGVIWSPTETKRTDNGASRDYISYKAVGGIKKADGQPVFFSAEYDMDFEVIEEEIRESHTKKVNAWKNKPADVQGKIEELTRRDVLQKRKHKLKLCEAGAMNRVLRMLLGLKQSYTTVELQKPFVMARIVFRPDFSDAAVRKQFVDASIKAMTGIYGPQALDQEIRNSKPIDITPITNDEEPPNGETKPPNGETKPPADETNHGSCEAKQPDFFKLDKPAQNVILENMIKVTGYNIKGYYERCGVTAVDQIVDKARTGLYEHLKSLPKTNMEAVPY